METTINKTEIAKNNEVISNSKSVLSDMDILSKLDSLNADQLAEQTERKSNNKYYEDYKKQFKNRNQIRIRFYDLSLPVFSFAKLQNKQLTKLSDVQIKKVIETNEFKTFAKEVKAALIDPLNRVKHTAKTDTKQNKDAILHFAFWLYNNHFVKK